MTMTMRATLYGGPGDGAELTMLEPIPVGLRFPTPAAAAAQQYVLTGESHDWTSSPAAYRLRLEVDPQGRETSKPARDARGRVTYLYLVPRPPRSTATPTEGEDHA